MKDQVIYEIEGLSFRYRNGDFKLNVEEMRVEKEGITGIVGPSGSGKTTLLLNLAFLLVGRWRRFEFEGRRVELEDLRSLRRRVTYVPQNPILFTGTAKSNILYPLKLRGIRGKEAKRRVEEVAEALDISEILGNKSHELSGGEAQRVCLARALVFSPDVILLDEPTANLDADNALRIEEMLRDISSRTKLILVSHNQEQVNRLCDKVYRLEGGRIVESYISSEAATI